MLNPDHLVFVALLNPLKWIVNTGALWSSGGPKVDNYPHICWANHDNLWAYDWGIDDPKGIEVDLTLRTIRMRLKKAYLALHPIPTE